MENNYQAEVCDLKVTMSRSQKITSNFITRDVNMIRLLTSQWKSNQRSRGSQKWEEIALHLSDPTLSRCGLRIPQLLNKNVYI